MSLLSFSKIIRNFSHSKYIFQRTTIDSRVCSNAGTIICRAGFKSKQDKNKKKWPNSNSFDKDKINQKWQESKRNLEEKIQGPETDHILSYWNKAKSSIPSLPAGFAVIGCVCNVIEPGLGTMLSGGFVYYNDRSKVEMVMTNLLVGVLQLATSNILIGWVWSIYWAYIMFQKRS